MFYFSNENNKKCARWNVESARRLTELCFFDNIQVSVSVRQRRMHFFRGSPCMYFAFALQESEKEIPC
jgi:hypothetical protein